MRELYVNTSGDCISSKLVELQIIVSEEVIRGQEIRSYKQIQSRSQM